MQAQSTVTLYVANRLDGALEVDPGELAAEFIQDAEAGCVLLRRGSMEFAYRWWIADHDGRNCTWDEDDWEAMYGALRERLDANPAVKDEMWKRVSP